MGGVEWSHMIRLRMEYLVHTAYTTDTRILTTLLCTVYSVSL